MLLPAALEVATNTISLPQKTGSRSRLVMNLELIMSTISGPLWSFCNFLKKNSRVFVFCFCFSVTLFYVFVFLFLWHKDHCVTFNCQPAHLHSAKSCLIVDCCCCQCADELRDSCKVHFTPIWLNIITPLQCLWCSVFGALKEPAHENICKSLLSCNFPSTTTMQVLTSSKA